MKKPLADEETVIKEAVKISIVSEALFKEYVNIDDEALMSDVMTNEDIVMESQKKQINEIKTDDKQNMLILKPKI